MEKIGRRQIEGILEKTVFQDEEDGYVVALLSLDPLGEPVTAVGRFTAIPGTTVRLKGTWIKNPKYGLQFKVDEAEVLPPATQEGIVRYLASSGIPGIGPVMAKRLVDRFGAETLLVIEKDPDRLAEVDGIGPSRIRGIRDAWDAQRETRDVMVFLQGHGVSPSFAHRIVRIYGRETIARILEDPYRLTRDIFGIGFKKADGIAKRIGMAPTSMARCRAGLLHALQTQAEEGHVYLPRDTLLEMACELLEIEPQRIEEALLRSARDGDVVLEPGDGDVRVYMRWLHEAETETSKALARILRGPSPLKKDVADLQAGGQVGGVALNAGQREILRGALTEKILVVTGGPGTGKTTAMRAMIRLLEAAGATVALAAPTGRAAKRLAEATGREAKTIHRLLEFQPSRRVFFRNQGRPIEAHAVIVDEASMIDLPLMYHLTQAIHQQACLVLVGDVDQLPSVGPGNVLKDIMASQAVRVVKLQEVFRQPSRSGIVQNAHLINHGELPKWPRRERETLSDFYFITQDDPRRIQETILNLCSKRIPSRFGMDPNKDIQVLTPMHRGPLGTEELNRLLQARLNPGRRGLARGTRRFALGDKVMQVRNNYDKEVFNGDIGIVVRVNQQEARLWVRFEESEIPYSWAEMEELVLAYAISVHKSQGSEYQAVIMPVVTQHYLMLQRNLLYTGITRAKRLVVLIGTHKAMAIAVKNDRIRKRYTALRERLQRDSSSG